MLSIVHNMAAMNANRQFNIVNTKRSKSAEKLSSGYRINRSADDAAGLAISEKMRRLIRGLTQASENVQDGVSFCQVADGALNEVHDILNRINELAVKSANGTNTDEDREYLDEETQELKKELKRIFKDTSFNEKYIWRQSYAPDVSRIEGEEQDFQTYNDTAGHTGGILVNHIRYSWNELGLADSIDDSTNTFTESGTKTITFDTGEQLELQWNEGDKIENITRVNRWKADSEGITINGNTAEKITWDQVQGVSGDTVTGDSITFEYHNAKFQVDVEDADSVQDLIDGINGDHMSGEVYWVTEAATTRNSAAIPYRTINVQGGSDDYLLATDWTLHADENEVWLSTSAGDDTRIAWSDFADVRTGKYPMSDFGTASESTDSVTLDNTATYKYEGSSSGFYMIFRVADAASKDALIQTLDGQTFTKTISTKMSDATASDDATGVSATLNTSSLNFAMQNVLGRTIAADSFNVKSSWADGMLTVEIAGDNHTATYTASLSEDDIAQMMTDRSSNTLTLTLANQDDLNSIITTSEANEGLKSLQTALNINLDFSKVTDTATAADVTTFWGRISTTASANAASIRLNSKSHATGIASSTIYNYKTIVPKKHMDIQAGSEAGQHIHLEWDALSLGTLSMGGLSLATADEAEAAIGTVKSAMQTISRQRSYFGAMQNCMEHTIANLDNVIENTTAAESQIRDTDMAKEMVAYSTQNILAQVGQSILAQTNQSKNGVLTLLQ